MSRAAIIHEVDGPATTITHVPGSGPSTISMVNNIMTIANSLTTGAVLSSVTVPNEIDTASPLDGVTGTVAAGPTGPGAVFTFTGPAVFLGTIPVGTQIVVTGGNSGPLKITGYVGPTTYIVASSTAGTFSLVDLAGNTIYTTDTAGSTDCGFSINKLTLQNNVNSLSSSGILTIAALGTPLAPGAPVEVSGTAIGGTIFGYSDPTIYYVAASPAPTTTSFALVDFSGARLSVTLTAPATAITGLSYTTRIANSPLSVTSIALNGTISSTAGVTYATGMAVSVTGTLTGTAVFTPSIDAQTGNVYRINASAAGTITLTSLTGAAIITRAGTTTGLTFTPCTSLPVKFGVANALLIAVPRSTTSPINNRWAYAWQFFSGGNWVAISDRFTVVVNLITTSTLSATTNTTAGDTGLYRCQITPTGTATTPITGATPTNSLPVFLSFQ